MKNFINWGIRIRKNENLNYYSVWHNLITNRLDLGETKELQCDKSEFYDVGLGTKCNAECSFCTPGNTLISTEFEFKQIKDINIGDKVWSFNSNTGNIELKKVIKTSVRPFKGQLINIDFKLRLTSNHKVFNFYENNWIESDKIITDNVTMAMISKKNNSIIPYRLNRLTRELYEDFVYNIEVEDNNNYFANGFLVHNCYVSALKGGEFWPSICKTWKNWIESINPDVIIDTNNLPKDDKTLKELLSKYNPKEDDEEIFKLKAIIKLSSLQKFPIIITEKPFQIAIGSTGEPTIHPEFCEFLKTVYESGVVPNYTTNGILLSNIKDQKCVDLLEATSKYCGGVAVSFGNKSLRDKAKQAIENLINFGDCKVMIHHLISDMNSVDELVKIAKEYDKKIHYHVLLPLMEHGRSKKGLEDGVFEYLAKELKKNNINNIALGANFTPSLRANPGLFNIYEYPQETYSKNILLKKENEITITPSSYNLKPIKIINL